MVYGPWHDLPPLCWQLFCFRNERSSPSSVISPLCTVYLFIRVGKSRVGHDCSRYYFLFRSVSLSITNFADKISPFFQKFYSALNLSQFLRYVLVRYINRSPIDPLSPPSPLRVPRPISESHSTQILVLSRSTDLTSLRLFRSLISWKIK